MIISLGTAVAVEPQSRLRVSWLEAAVAVEAAAAAKGELAVIISLDVAVAA